MLERLLGILKSYDRIGFGRRGVLDAEDELCRFAAALPAAEHGQFCAAVSSWLEAGEAERVTAALHYNLPEHLQELAIRLCASVPMPATLPVLERLWADGSFATAQTRACREALRDALAQLRRAAGAAH